MSELNVYELVRKNESNYRSGDVKTSKYVVQSFYEDISTIEAYLNSKHISGDKDSMGRDKPFFNIVLAVRNIWFRATDLDRKNVIAKAKKQSDYLASLLYTGHLKKWMRDENFGQYLNDWGLYLASYNSAVTKFIEKSDGLHISVIPWQSLIVDVLGFEKNPKIEVLEMTQDELRSHTEYDQEMVEGLIEAQTGKKMIDGQPKNVQKANHVRLYEVHGVLPLSWLTDDDKDKDTYIQQMQVVSFLTSKKGGEFDNFTLYSGRETNDPYMLTQLIPAVDGSISLMGAVKTLFDAQWMTNHTIKNIKDQLDLASKLIFQTNDSGYANQNVLENIEQGQIMVYGQDKNPLTQIQNNSHDISALESFMKQWQVLAQEVSNTPEVTMGRASSAQSAYAKEALMLQQSQQNFDIMTQNKGLSLEQMFKKFITPFVLKKLNNSDELVMELGDYGIEQIDKKYISSRAAKVFNYKAVEAVLSSQDLPDLQEETQKVRQEVTDMGMQRFIRPSEISAKTWKDIFEDFESDVEYQITDENVDKNNVMQGINSLMQTLANPNGQAFVRTPEGKLLFNETLNLLGIINPVQIQEQEPQQVQQQPQQAQQKVGGTQPITQ